MGTTSRSWALAFPDLSEEFGRSLQEKRKEAGLSQETLANKAQLTRNYVSLLERGLRNPTLNTMAAIAKALDTTLQGLVDGIGASKPGPQ